MGADGSGLRRVARVGRSKGVKGEGKGWSRR